MQRLPHDLKVFCSSVIAASSVVPSLTPGNDCSRAGKAWLAMKRRPCSHALPIRRVVKSSPSPCSTKLAPCPMSSSLQRLTSCRSVDFVESFPGVEASGFGDVTARIRHVCVSGPSSRACLHPLAMWKRTKTQDVTQDVDCQTSPAHAHAHAIPFSVCVSDRRRRRHRKRGSSNASCALKLPHHICTICLARADTGVKLKRQATLESQTHIPPSLAPYLPPTLLLHVSRSIPYPFPPPYPP